MTFQLFCFFALNLMVNSLLSFFTVALLMQLVIAALRIQSARVKAFLMLIPMVKLVLDPFFYSFQQWAINHQVNPMCMPVGSRMFSLVFCWPHSSGSFPPTAVKIGFFVDGYTFTLADMLALSANPAWLFAGILMTAVVAAVSLTFFVHLWRQSSKSAASFLKSTRLRDSAFMSLSLKKKISHQRCRLGLSEEVFVPCAVGFFEKFILIPSTHSFSQQELEAVIAHELEHHRWHDNASRLFCRFVSALFWWVPTRWWINRIEANQEMAADEGVALYGIKPADLASAIIKTARNSRGAPPVCSLALVGRNIVHKRVCRLLAMRKDGMFPLVRLVLAALFTAVFLTGRFWIF